MNIFADLDGLDLKEAKKDISFPIIRESLHTEDNLQISKEAVISLANGEKEVLGLVSKKRGNIPYSEVMSWVTDIFDKVGVPFKLKESVLVGKSKHLFQSYIFDTEVAVPDGQDVSPMLILRSSYTGSPMKIDLGTYRFVCSNGVTVGKTMSSLSLKAKDLESLMKHDLFSSVKQSLEDMKTISKRYYELYDESMNSYLMEFFTAPFVSVAFKKAMFDNLSTRGIIEKRTKEIVKGNQFNVLNLTGNIATFKRNDEAFKILEEKNAWDLYNIGTEISSHQTMNVSSRDWYNRTLSEIFAA